MSDDRPVPRRSFFRMGLRKAAQAAADAMAEMGQHLSNSMEGARHRSGSPPPSYPVPNSYAARPPGAVSGTRFFELCTKCDDCVTACPAWAIRKAGDDEPNPGYPLLEPNVTACAVCDDPIPCVAACETGALQPLPRTSIRLGLARLDPMSCVVPQGQPCDFCVVYCPVPEQAIRMDETEGPVIAEQGCTGCGMCVVMCPDAALEVGSAH